MASRGVTSAGDGFGPAPACWGDSTSDESSHRPTVPDEGPAAQLDEDRLCHCLEKAGYRDLSILGSGTFGVVAAATMWDGSRRALKCILPRTAPERELVDSECNALKTLLHPNVVQLFGTFALPANEVVSIVDLSSAAATADTPRYLYVLDMCFCAGGDLKAYMNNYQLAGKHIAPQTLVRVAHSVQSALAFCNSRGVCHRDIKPQNIFFTRGLEVQLGDFGLAVWMTADNMPHEPCGTLCYMAPEVWRDGVYGEECDQWSLGVTVYEAVTFTLPFGGDGVLLDDFVRAGLPPRELDKNQLWDRDLWQRYRILQDVIMRMVRQSPQARIAASEAVDLLEPWLDKGSSAIPTSEGKAEKQV